MKTLFNNGWQFAKIHLESADAPLPSEADLLSFPDDRFAPVTIPHDWLIWNTNDLYENSIGIYKKNFRSVAASASARNRTIIRFEGVYMDTSVYINGTKATEWKYGYTTFEVDVTRFLKDGENTITVISVYRSPNTRWYSGAGIFRDVWLLEVPETHLVSDGVYFTADRLDDGSWTAKIKAEACYLPIVSHSPDVDSPDVDSPDADSPDADSPGVHTPGNSFPDGSAPGKRTPGTSFPDGIVPGVRTPGVSFPAKTTVVRFLLANESGTAVAETTRTVTLNPVVTDDPYWYLDPDGASVAEAEFHLENVLAWDIDAPHLYTLTAELYETDPCSSCLDSNASHPQNTAHPADNASSCFGGIAYTLPSSSHQPADRASSAFKACGRLLDSCTQKVGFRTIRFDKDDGFFLNGRRVKLNGACMHHDLGALGAAFNLTALKRQFTKLQDMGVNAIRLSHNPPAPALMTLADEMGLLIDSECFDMWEKPKTEYDYARFFPDWHERDVASWIRRNRNHPSLIMWSIGNEIYDTHQGNGFAITQELAALVRKHDSAKNAPVTIASNYMEWQGAQSCAELVDLAGYNYGERLYEGHHKSHPDWQIYGSETGATVQSRGVYHFPAHFRMLTHDDSQCSSLGNCSVNWGAANAADTVIRDRDTPFSAGQFIWTGWDYIGEPTPYFTKNSFFGQIDTAGFEKDTFYQYQAEWTDYRIRPMVHLLPYWDFNEGQLIDVRAYTNAPQVELLLNGKSLGIQQIDHAHGLKLSGEWQLPFAPGTITAIARDSDGKELARESRTTPGDPYRLVVKADKVRFSSPRDTAQPASLAETPEVDTSAISEGSDGLRTVGSDLIFVEIHTVDKDGNPVDNARNRVTVEVTGTRLEGLDNGDSTDNEQYKTTSRKLFNNALIAILAPDPSAPDAPVTLTVTSPGLEGATCLLNTLSEARCADKAPDTFKAPGAQPLSEAASANQAPDVYKTAGASAEVPVRKIELTVVAPPGSLSENQPADKAADAFKAPGARALSPENSEVTVYARILPENATYRALKFVAVRLEGIASRAVALTPLPVTSGDVLPADAPTADAATPGDALPADAVIRVTARQDGEFRLRCSCDNGTDIPEIISELEFSVSGMGTTCLNPYEFISACEKSASLNECKLSFLGGVYIPAGRNWISFENVDFGPDGSDTFTIPIFSFDTTMQLELWDGNPDSGGTLLMQAEYNSPSWYNHYQSNTWTLPRRLTGIHDLYILTDTSRFSIQGFQFEKSRKAFSRLSALDADSITGDSFTREANRISGIGNNVSLEFSNMDFGSDSVKHIHIKGRAVNGTNTVHILFVKDGTEEADGAPHADATNALPANVAQPAEMRTAVEIPATDEITEHSFDLNVTAPAKCRVVFVFLPGSCFDFEGFQFEK